MRQVVLKMHVSLDGYVRAGDGDVMDWIFRTYDDELKAWEVDLLWQAGTHIMGRRLYEEMAAYWPTSTEVFAPPMNEIPKVVFSRTTHGGAEFAQGLSRLGLIDEYRLIVHPVVLAGGLPLFKHQHDLKLLDARQFRGGAIALTYARAGGDDA